MYQNNIRRIKKIQKNFLKRLVYVSPINVTMTSFIKNKDIIHKIVLVILKVEPNRNI